MEFKGEHLQAKKKSFEEEEAMAASSSFFHLLSLLHHVVRGCAGYLGLSRLCDSLKDPKPDSTSAVPAAISQEEGDNNKVPDDSMVIEVQSRSVAVRRDFNPVQGPGGNGGKHH